MKKHHTLVTLVAIGSLAAGAAGCGDDDTTSGTTGSSAAPTTGAATSAAATSGAATTNSATSSTTATVAPSTAPEVTTTTLAVIHYPGGATYVTGWIADFSISEGTSETDADGVQHTRGGAVSYRLVSDDPRVAGMVTGTWNTDRWGVYTDGVMTQWGEATLTNEVGTWEASYRGAFASPVGDILTRWWRGSGGYEGLTFYMWITGSTLGSSEFEWGGIIVPGDPPPSGDA